MRLTLTSDGLARLEEATRTLLSPLAAPDTSAWRSEAMRSVCAALGAESGSFTLPGQGATVEAVGLDNTLIAGIERYTAETWSGRGGSPEPLLDVFYRRVVDQRLEVWDMYAADHLLGGTGAAWRNQFYDEVLQPSGLDDTQALFAPFAGGSAMLTTHHLRRPARPGEHLALLRLLLPAFKAGLDALARFGAQRAALDLLAEPLIVFGVDGHEVHRNAALTCRLGREPEAPRVLDEIRCLADALRGLGFSRPGDSAGLPIDRTVRTRLQTYRLRGTLLAAGPFGADGAVLIAVMPEAAPALPPPEALRERFGLTGREAEVALLLAEGASNAALADRLCISPHTARHHTEQVFAKLNLHTRKALALTLLQPV